MLAALRAMQAAGTLAPADIEVVLTGDEERSGDPVEIARADLVAAGKRADVALDFEGLVRDGGRDMGSIARRSSYSWTLTATGRTGHRSEEHTSELQSLMRSSYAVFCLKKKNTTKKEIKRCNRKTVTTLSATKRRTDDKGQALTTSPQTDTTCHTTNS